MPYMFEFEYNFCRDYLSFLFLYLFYFIGYAVG